MRDRTVRPLLRPKPALPHVARRRRRDARHPRRSHRPLASGYRRGALLSRDRRCQGALRRANWGDEAVVRGAKRDAVQIEGFDLGASPREYLEPRGRDGDPDDDEMERGRLSAGSGKTRSTSCLGRPAQPGTLFAAAGRVSQARTSRSSAPAIQGAFRDRRRLLRRPKSVALPGRRADRRKRSPPPRSQRAYPTAWDGVERAYVRPARARGRTCAWCTQENTLSVVPPLQREWWAPAAEITGV